MTIPLTDSMSLYRFTHDELVSIQSQAIRSGLVGLSIRAGVAIRQLDAHKIESRRRPQQ
jgi:hypothetical protein